MYTKLCTVKTAARENSEFEYSNQGMDESDVLANRLACLDIEFIPDEQFVGSDENRGSNINDCTVPLKFPPTPFELPHFEGRAFVLRRELQLEVLMNLYCTMVFEGLHVRSVIWSKRLNTTAGVTKLMTEGSKRTASIELATKVIGTEPRGGQ